MWSTAARLRASGRKGSRPIARVVFARDSRLVSVVWCQTKPDRLPVGFGLTPNESKVRRLGAHVERVSSVAIDEYLDETVDDLWALWQRCRAQAA